MFPLQFKGQRHYNTKEEAEKGLQLCLSVGYYCPNGIKQNTDGVYYFYLYTLKSE